MPKTVGARKVLSLRNVPTKGSITVNTTKRSRGKNGRAKSTQIKTSYDPLPPEPTSPKLPAWPQQLPDEPVSDGEADKQPVPPTRKGPSRAVSAKLVEWLSWREEFLGELLRLEAVGGQQLECASCQSPASYRCKDCFGGALLCQNCLLAAHTQHPFHRVEQWNGDYFRKESLAALGLSLQLGHTVGERCPHPSSCHKLTIFDLTGVHQVMVRYCICSLEDGGYRRRQLLRSRLFPATFVHPQTAFSFRLLDFFHRLQSINKTNVYDFYNTIVRLTDSAGLSPEVYRYNEISLVYRIWVHLHMLKRGGAAHYPGGLESLPEGSMAVECPACPQPARNVDAESLANDWKSTLIIALDACFKLKLKDRSFNDPDLGTGLSYMVGEQKYKSHITRCETSPSPKETSTCGSMLHAVNEAHTKSSRGYLATGVVISSCRHALVRPNGAADLQRGERYLNTDYAFASSIQQDINNGIRQVLVTYDIGCQWGINLQQRLSTYSSPLDLDLNSLTSFRIAVPKFHLVGHGASCQVPYNLAYMDGVGLTHGEGVETIWAGSSSLATWSRENGPGARHQILDDHWASWNWRKTVNLRVTLRKSLDKAWKWSKAQHEVARALDATLSEEAISRWERMVIEWKRDHTNPNPFEEPITAPSLDALRRKFLQEESDAKKLPGYVELHKTTPASFLRMALDIEEKQRILRSRYCTGTSNSIHQLESVRDQRGTLSRLIEELRSPQRIYMPGCIECLDEIEPKAMVDAPESVNLWLPSALGDRYASCVPGLPLLEFRLRYAEAIDSLEQLRCILRVIRSLRFQTTKHITGSQRTAPPGRGVFQGLHARITHVSARYRDHVVALRRLHPSGKWKDYLRDLKKDDISGPAPEENDPSKSRFIPSWIWTIRAPASPPDVPGSPSQLSGANNNVILAPPPADTATYETISMSQEDIDRYVMVDWAKARERSKRFMEEVKLCVEEMRRVLAFFLWSAEEWRERARLCQSGDGSPLDGVCRGLRAYALRRSAMFEDLIRVFASDWGACLNPKRLGGEWFTEYSIATDEGNQNPSLPTLQPSSTTYDQPLAEIDEQDNGSPVELDEEAELDERFLQLFLE